MIYSAQIRAARALIAWSQSQLAEAAGIGSATVKRMEASPGLLLANAGNVWRVQKALEAAGVVFLNATRDEGPGVRLSSVPLMPELPGDE